MKTLFLAQRQPRFLGPATVLAQLIALGVLAASCNSAPSEAVGSASNERVRKAVQTLAGVDGDRTISAAGTVVNQYTSLDDPAVAGATSIVVTNIAALADGTDPLANGDLLMILQMQGAAISTVNNDTTWGTVTALNGAGLYELVEVLSVTGNTVTLSCGLKNAYLDSETGATQVVRVPQYDMLTIATGASVTAPAWNGSVGGVVAIHARSTVTLSGSIDVSALGFRGGATENFSTGSGVDTTIFASLSAESGALKGEGIAGVRAEYGRAPAANGGGGGNAHNAGGGGGANGRFGASWTGLGIFDPSVLGGAVAWLLDPRYSAIGSQGGGRGGYSYSASPGNALTVGPNNASWGGNSRRERGGLGGHPLDNDPSLRIFAGGGGGAGDGNNGHAARGGNGGGIVLLIAGSVTGSGQILANGEVGETSDSTTGGSASGDGPGGGGGGGTVILHGATVSGVSVQAQGGVGGGQIINNANECEGPGGGGGGGYVYSTGTVVADVSGALGGVTSCSALVEFPTNGATRGSPGQTALGGSVTLPYCADTTLPDTAIDTTPTTPTNDATGDFTFSSPDTTATFECRLDAGAFAACTTPFTTAALGDGSHTLTVRARDAIGNLDATPAEHTWVVDTEVPDTTIVTAPTNPTSDVTGDFSFSSPDTTASFECRLDAGSFAACSATFATAALALGSHTLEVRARDAAGNIDATPASHTWLVVVGDTDQDGLTDDEEITLGTDPEDADTDDDGVPDGAEIDGALDTDEDGLINALDPDSDNDGLFDGTELGLGCGNPGTDLSRGLCRADSDPATTTSPIDADTDGGGVSDGSEDLNLNGAIDSGETNPTTGNGADDAQVTDSDNDGLSDGTEITIGSNPNDLDTDDDGVPDGQEANPSADDDGDGLVNVLDVDSDNDGLFDGTEMGLGCSLSATNALLGHCRPDADPDTTTSPLNPDTDGGGVRDGSEDSNLNGRLDTGETDPTEGNPLDDTEVVDTDGDGLSDGMETTIGTSPTDVDSDDDGVLDGAEPNPSDDHDGDGLPNALDPDSDQDGLFDGTESGQNCANPATDPAANQCIADGDSGETTTGILQADTDNGGVLDGVEDSNHNGEIDTGETDPLDPSDDDRGAVGGGGAGGEAGAGPAGAGGGGQGGADGGFGGDDQAGQGGGGAGGEATVPDPGSGGRSPSGGAANGGSAVTGGTAGAGDPADPSDEETIVLGGGLCAYHPATAVRSSLGLLVFAGLALAFGRRRTRRRNRGG